jgi:hypothetical protein
VALCVCVSVYRRLLELERKAYPNATPAFRSSIRSALKQSMRAPDQAMHYVSQSPAVVALLGQVGRMSGLSEGLRKQLMDGFSALIKTTPGVNEAELWRRAKEEEGKQTQPR